MTEFQIISQFNSFLISNALYLMVFTFLLFMAYGGVYRMNKDGATILGKVLGTLFSTIVVYFNCLTLGFLYAQQQGAAYSLSQLDNLSESAQSFVDFFDGGSLDAFSLIPADPLAVLFFIVVLISLILPIWTAPEPKE
jgi:lysylphosphatidylglycerol synthetase-like protein (DUF2156 family)|tara:strand:- start:83 stop:496 length:414 start_codon:yes stop_codon:yes gene_type:complete